MKENLKVQREILIFLSNRIRINDGAKHLSQAKRTKKFLAYDDAITEVENWGKKTDIHKGQGSPLATV